MIPVTIGSIFLTIESPPDSFRPIGPRAQTNRHGKSFTMCVKTFNFFSNIILYANMPDRKFVQWICLTPYKTRPLQFNLFSNELFVMNHRSYIIQVIYQLLLWKVTSYRLFTEIDKLHQNIFDIKIPTLVYSTILQLQVRSNLKSRSSWVRTIYDI